MLDLPNLLLSYGIKLKQVGNEYSCLCFAHDDHNPSMSVYINGTGKHVAHCFSCGFHGDVYSAYCELNGLDTLNPEHFLQAKAVIDNETFISTGKPFAIIENSPKLKQRPERTMLIPDENTPHPKMGWLKGKNGMMWGDPSEVFIFRQESGLPLMYEARWNITDNETGEIKKECRCFTWGKRGSAPAKWECAHHAEPRPLYGLDILAKYPDSQIIITEGPRKAAYAQKLLPMLPCIGWAGGANAWNKSDWSIIRNRNVILWPDNDDPGRKCMEEIAQQLISRDCNVFMLDTTAMPDSWDAADAFNEGWNTEKTLAWAKSVKGEQIEKKTVTEIVSEEPPEIELPTVDSYTDIKRSEETKEYEDIIFAHDPVDIFHEFVVPELKRDYLPKVIADYVFDRSEVINTDPAYGALTAIITCAGLIDDRIKIRVSHDWTESARLWGCIVGEPSAKKSPIMDAVLNSSARAIVPDIVEQDAESQRRQNILDKRYQAKLKDYEKACIESDSHNELPPVPPQRIERKRVLCDNMTREGLEEALRDMPRGILVTSDEISAWIGSMDAYKAAGVKADRAFWLRAYNGGAMQIDKVGRGSFMIENWSCSIIGGIQPSKLKSIAHDLGDDGLLQRFLIVCSNRDGGIGSERAPDANATRAWRELAKHLYNTEHSAPVEMSEGAKAIRRQAVTQIYEMIAANTISSSFCTHLGKWEGISARLILIYHCIECAGKQTHPSTIEVSEQTAQIAIDYLMQHLLPHAISFYEDGLGQSDIHEIARILAGRILAEGKTELTLTWLGQSSPSRYRSLNEDKRRQVLSRLVELSWLEPVGLYDSLNKRYKRYLVNPAVKDKFAGMQQEEQDKLNRAREMAEKIKSGKMLQHKEKIY